MGSEPVLIRNPIFFVIFQWWSGPPVSTPSGSAHDLISKGLTFCGHIGFIIFSLFPAMCNGVNATFKEVLVLNVHRVPIAL